MKRTFTALALTTTAALALAVQADGQPTEPQDEESALILACDNDGICGPQITQYLGGNAWRFIITPGSGKSVCAAIKGNPSGVDGVNDALDVIESNGFSRMESVAVLIEIVGMDCEDQKAHLYNWAVTPGHAVQ